MIRIAFSLLGYLLGAATIIGFKTAQIPMPWWGSILILIGVWWVSFTAGVAFITSRNASATIGDLQIGPSFPPSEGAFFLSIKNGPLPAEITITIPPIRGPRGGDITLSSWTVHWRERTSEHPFDGYFKVDQGEQAGLLGIFRSPNGHPGLVLWGTESGKDRQKWISRDVPLAEQDTLTLDVSITMRTDSEIKADRPGWTELRTYSIVPNMEPNSSYPYKVIGVKPTVDDKRRLVRVWWRFLNRRLRFLGRSFRANHGNRRSRRLR
jgi:hypothetical protein